MLISPGKKSSGNGKSLGACSYFDHGEKQDPEDHHHLHTTLKSIFVCAVRCERIFWSSASALTFFNARRSPAARPPPAGGQLARPLPHARSPAHPNRIGFPPLAGAEVIHRICSRLRREISPELRKSLSRYLGRLGGM